MSEKLPVADGPTQARRASVRRRMLRRRVLRWGPTRIRGKLIFLHTMFSLTLAVILLLVLHRPIRDLVYESESREALLALEFFAATPDRAQGTGIHGIEFRSGSAVQLRLDEAAASAARAEPGRARIIGSSGGALTALRFDEARGEFQTASVRIAAAQAAVNRLYLLLTLSLLAVYALIALTLEVFVLPNQVYRPIETLLQADEAVRTGDREEEIIPEPRIPPDEIGRIMRSRNQSIHKLRRQEGELGRALQRLEEVAGELKRKNHLLEATRQNLADQERLASLGMMSAGIAHELNTPLVVLKGCAEELAAAERQGKSLPPERVALMLRVINRLERLSESLLDFARARPARSESVRVREIIEEAWTLVSLDRSAARVRIDIRVSPETLVRGDPDRLTQVFVNLLRNAADALERGGQITVSAESARREGGEWLSITVCDNGPGIDPAILTRLFEPFASTRLDAQGTGLGLAVAEGIVLEHGGVLLARNAAPPDTGATLEVMLPLQRAADRESTDTLNAGADAANGAHAHNPSARTG